LCSSAEQRRTFWRMPFEYDARPMCRAEVRSKSSSKSSILRSRPGCGRRRKAANELEVFASR
jgi:hypothetical protein